MKIKQYLHITDTERFLRGDYDGCFTLFDHESGIDEWVFVGEIDLDIDIDIQRIISKTTSALDKEIEMERQVFTKRLASLERRKNELLALEHIA